MKRHEKQGLGGNMSEIKTWYRCQLANHSVSGYTLDAESITDAAIQYLNLLESSGPALEDYTEIQIQSEATALTDSIFSIWMHFLVRDLRWHLFQKESEKNKEYTHVHSNKRLGEHLDLVNTWNNPWSEFGSNRPKW